MRKIVGHAPTAGEQTQQKPCRTSSDIGAKRKNRTVGRGSTYDRKELIRKVVNRNLAPARSSQGVLINQGKGCRLPFRTHVFGRVELLVYNTTPFTLLGVSQPAYAAFIPFQMIQSDSNELTSIVVNI
jgi:hypothetical protein